MTRPNVFDQAGQQWEAFASGLPAILDRLIEGIAGSDPKGRGVVSDFRPLLGTGAGSTLRKDIEFGPIFHR